MTSFVVVLDDVAVADNGVVVDNVVVVVVVVVARWECNVGGCCGWRSRLEKKFCCGRRCVRRHPPAKRPPRLPGAWVEW